MPAVPAIAAAVNITLPSTDLTVMAPMDLAEPNPEPECSKVRIFAQLIGIDPE
jgi:hypothetical protein